jgi:aspartate aminotransferase
MMEAFEERQNFVVAECNKMDGVECLPSDGTFYSFPNVEGLIERLDGVNNDAELATYLLDKGVSLVPGSAFGLEGHIRISYATSMENLKKAIERIASL